jgi:hypothetical protein
MPTYDEVQKELQVMLDAIAQIRDGIESLEGGIIDYKRILTKREIAELMGKE